jgi:hypothetical protein
MAERAIALFSKCFLICKFLIYKEETTTSASVIIAANITIIAFYLLYHAAYFLASPFTFPRLFCYYIEDLASVIEQRGVREE